MKHLTRLTVLLLCAAMLFSMIGCTAVPEPTVPPTAAPTEAPTEPQASDLYTAACSATLAKEGLTMNISSTMTTSVAGQSLTQASEQVISYTGLGTDSMKYQSTENITYGEDHSYTYGEIFVDGMLYAAVDDTEAFCGEMAASDAAQRYLSPAMLDTSLYGSITAGENGKIIFEAPTAAESWAMPGDAELLEASGSAVISENGTLEQVSYAITYQHGPSKIHLAVDAAITFGTVTVTVPADSGTYIQLDDVDALCLYINALGMLSQSGAASSSMMESVMSQAAAVVRNQSTAMDLYSKDGNPDAKVEINIYMMDYSTNQEQRFEQEERYVDGKYTLSVDGADPEAQSGISAEMIQEYCTGILGANLVRSEFWQNAQISDLGSTLLVELTLTEEFGDTMEGAICNTFWSNSQFLRKLSSGYVNKETTGYLAIDKFTGLPTATGYYYEGIHTIQGGDYILSLQCDQSLDGASLSAYHSIRDELPPEEEPENKATPLFYHVTGDNGQEMWLMGTIHVGDERTAYLPQEIYDAFAASDALALEFDSEAFEEAMEEDEALQNEVSDSYYYGDGTQTSDHVDEEVYEEAVKYLKASGNYNMNAPYMKPSIWSNSIENFYLRQGYHLTSEQGMEERLTQLAHEQGKEILDVESGLFQMKMLTGWSEALHAQLLEDSLDTSALDYIEGVAELYELWCAGDEAAMREELRSTVDTSEMTEEEKAEYEEQKPLIDEYNKAMSYDRNDGMLDVAIEYLESGDVIFYAVGLAHLLDDVNGLVDTLRAAGYTVELVEYAK